MANNRVIYVIPFEDASSIDINTFIDHTVACGYTSITIKLFHPITGAQLLPYNNWYNILSHATITQQTLLYYQSWYQLLHNKEIDILFALDIAPQYLQYIKDFSHKVPIMVDMLIDISSEYQEIDYDDRVRTDINFLVLKPGDNYLSSWQQQLQSTSFNQDIYFLNEYNSDIWNLFLSNVPMVVHKDYSGFHDISLSDIIDRKKQILPYIFMIKNNVIIPVDFGIHRYCEHWNKKQQFNTVEDAIYYKKEIEPGALFKYVLKNMPCKTCQYQNICVATQSWAPTDNSCTKKVFWDNAKK